MAIPDFRLHLIGPRPTLPPSFPVSPNYPPSLDCIHIFTLIVVRRILLTDFSQQRHCNQPNHNLRSPYHRPNGASERNTMGSNVVETEITRLLSQLLSALYLIRSLLRTTTNATLHERFNLESVFGTFLPKVTNLEECTSIQVRRLGRGSGCHRVQPDLGLCAPPGRNERYHIRTSAGSGRNTRF